jgi:hypothetical protein
VRIDIKGKDLQVAMLEVVENKGRSWIVKAFEARPNEILAADLSEPSGKAGQGVERAWRG